MRIRQTLAVTLLAAASSSVPVRTDAIEQTEQLTRNTMALEGKSERGARLFRTECASCHGSAAHGDAARLIPALAAQRRAYLIKQLVEFSEGERVTTRMHAVVVRSKARDPQTWADIALYLNSLPPLSIPVADDGKTVEFGEAAYQQWCASCHEADARGDDDGFVPALRNQHYQYLLNEIRSMGAGHRFSLEPDLQRFLAGLEPDEFAAIADFLARLRGPVRDRAKLQDDGSLSD